MRKWCHCHFKLDEDRTRREDAWLLARPHIGARDRRYPNRQRREQRTVCCEESDPADDRFETERGTSQIEVVTRQAVLVITFTRFPTGRNLSQRQSWNVLTKRMTIAEKEAMIGLREARGKLHHATNSSRRFYQKGDNGREHATSNRPEEGNDMQSMCCAGSLGR